MVGKTLEGKVALVTGGNGGIGKAIVTLLVEHGAKVASVDLLEPESAADANIMSVKCNVSLERDVDKAVGQILEKFGQLDILVNCAGVMDDFSSIGDLPNAIWVRCFAVNVNGPMHLIRSCMPELLKTKGAIVNVCSTAAVRGSAAGVAYTASKHALLGISRSTAWMYAKKGLRCNAILPGATPGTSIMQHTGVGMEAIRAAQEGPLAPYMACTPGLCVPEDIANAVVFLATAPAVNGAELAVDHGWTVA